MTVPSIILFPALAGVIPAAVRVAAHAGTIPRTRGGDPRPESLVAEKTSYSPHSRGCLSNFAAPVILNGTRGHKGVAVNLNGKHCYAHKITLPDDRMLVMSEKTMQHENCPGEWSFLTLLPTPQVLHL